METASKDLIKNHLLAVVRFAHEVPFDDVQEIFQGLLKILEKVYPTSTMTSDSILFDILPYSLLFGDYRITVSNIFIYLSISPSRIYNAIPQWVN